jgi:hypothetical protein
MPHRRALGEQALDQRAETELGRMVLRGELGDDGAMLATAGETYARLWRGYVSTLDGPHLPANGPGHALGCNGGCPSPQDRRYCLCWMRKRIYFEAAAVLASTGGGVAAVVQGVVIYDRQCRFEALQYLKRGLFALAYHFGLTNQRKFAFGNAPSQNATPARVEQ